MLNALLRSLFKVTSLRPMLHRLLSVMSLGSNTVPAPLSCTGGVGGGCLPITLTAGIALWLHFQEFCSSLQKPGDLEKLPVPDAGPEQV